MKHGDCVRNPPSAAVAQSVERHIGNVEVTGSIPVSSSYETESCENGVLFFFVGGYGTGRVVRFQVLWVGGGQKARKSMEDARKSMKEARKSMGEVHGGSAWRMRRGDVEKQGERME